MIDREKFYEEWSSTKYEGDVLFSKILKKDFDKFTDYNFDMYVKYQNYCLNDDHMPLRSFKQRRATISEFLSSGIGDLNINTQKNIDKFFLNILNKTQDTTYMSKLSYIDKFLQFCKRYADITYTIEELRLKGDEIEISQKNTGQILTAEQISKCKEKYINDLIKLYIFEMLYYTGFEKSDLDHITYSDFDIIDNSITYKRKKEIIPNKLADLIEKLSNEWILTKTTDLATIIKNMKIELQEFGIINFKPRDLKDTHTNRFFKCPQCGRIYEAIVENWCAKQFTENGDFWIVCKEFCGNGR